MTPEEVNAVSRWQLSMTEKVVGGCIIALLGWMALTTQSTATKVAVIEARLATATEGRYTTADATRDSKVTEEKIISLSKRVEALERRIGE